MINIDVEKLSQDRFERFGKIISLTNGCPVAANKEITYWDKVSELQMGRTTSTGILEIYRREKIVTQMERHKNSPEIMIGIEGDSVVLFGKPGGRAGEDLAAFVIRQGEAVAMHEGTWHWSPFPLDDIGRILVIFKSGTPDDDLEICPLAESVKIDFSGDGSGR